MPKLISILTPVYNESENLPDYFQRINSVFNSNPHYQFEFILIDDGSSDNSWDAISKESKINPAIHGIKLSRNMGSHIAVSAGFNAAKGDAVCTLACDLQDPPETILKFIEEWEKGANVVYGVRASRQDDAWKKIASKTFENLLRRWAMPKGSLFATGSFLLIDKKVNDYFNQFKENNRITFAIIAHMGFKQARVFYERVSRNKGVSGWSPLRMFRALYDALIGFSYVPVRILTVVSICSLLLCVPLSIYVLYLYFEGRSSNVGWVSTILVITFFCSLILFNLSMVLQYLIRIYANTTQRPLYFIEETTS